MGFKTTLMMWFVSYCCWAQFQIHGRVFQANNRESLAFANIKIQGAQTATLIADIDGQFHWKGTWQPQSVTASFVGYQSQSLPWPADGKLFFYLTPSNDALQEVVVAIKENPAWRIIRAASARVEQNNPENYPWFSYECYNKVQYNIRGPKVDSIRASLDKRLQNSPLFLMESVTRRQFKAPNASTEEILANRVSGFKDPSFASLATDLQPFSLYQSHIDLLNIHYVNPLRKGSLKLYHYQLRDTLLIHGDSVFVIAYRPLKNTRFDGLKGVLYINNNGWALQNVTAEPAEPGKINVKIEQKYQRTPQGKWFPEQLNYELIFSELPSPEVNMFVQGKSYIRHVDLTPPTQAVRFPLEKVWMSDQATRKDSLYWQAHRPELLIKPEQNIYKILDSIGEKHHFDAILKGVEKFARGRIGVGKIDIDLSKTLMVNQYEGPRWGTGLYTSDTWLKHFGLGAFAGYGQSDYVWKYGGSAYWEFAPKWRWKIGGIAEYNLYEWGGYGQRKADTQRLDLRNFLSWQFDQGQHYGAHISGYSAPRWFWQLGYDAYHTTPTKVPETYWPTAASSHQVGTIALQFRTEGGVVRALGQDIVLQSVKPVVDLQYQVGHWKTLDLGQTYHKCEGRITQQWYTPAFGLTAYRLEAGITDAAVSPAVLFTGYGSFDEKMNLIVPNYFQTLRPYELAYDRYAQLFLKHSFEGLLLKIKKFQPHFSVLHNVLWGDVRQNTAEQWGLEQASGRWFVESGLQADQLLKMEYYHFGYIGFGAGVFYRYGGYALPKASDNWAFKLSLSFSIK